MVRCCLDLSNEVSRPARVDGVDALVLEMVRRVAAVQAAARRARARALLHAGAPRHAPPTLPTTIPRSTHAHSLREFTVAA